MFNMKLVKTLLILLILLQAGPLSAAEVDGKKIALQGGNSGTSSCDSCHGMNGQGMESSGFPYLAGLPAEYIKNQLDAYANGSRKNKIMKPIAKKLQKKEVHAVAKYYAGLENKSIQNAKLDRSTQYDKGERLVHTGKWESGVPACVKCHGSNGAGLSTHFPPIVGQPYEYLRSQLLAWKKDKRNNDPLALMQSVTAGLSKDEIDSVAHYLASQ
jgi:cytochrome c553